MFCNRVNDASSIVKSPYNLGFFFLIHFVASKEIFYNEILSCTFLFLCHGISLDKAFIFRETKQKIKFRTFNNHHNNIDTLSLIQHQPKKLESLVSDF